MLSAEGCRQRRQRFWQQATFLKQDAVLLAQPMHLMYLANFWVDPFSLGGGFGGYLLLRRDGHATLIHDQRLPKSVQEAHADATEVVKWYDGQSPGVGPRQLALNDAVRKLTGGAAFVPDDSPGTETGARITETLAKLRRQKDPDEIELLRRCMRATDTGHAWARTHVHGGMTELDVYRGISSACAAAAGQAVIVYGDFAVSPGPERRGGPPTERVLQSGDMLILDYSVVIGGYRSDFTNTLVVGGAPTADQHRLYELCVAAMAAGERELRAGAACLTVYDAVRGVFAQHGVADSFPHHAGHGLGLTHPEAPFFVRHADETLLAGDVVTLEPGLYVAGVGGIRIEHNYLVTAQGYERLSNHTISLK
jgi:Xaa-Pro aminopeptidase